MKKITKYLILSAIFFGFSSFYLIIGTFYGERPPESIASSFRIINPKVLPYLNPYTINPFDYYFSKLENYLIYMSYFFALWFFGEIMVLSFLEKYPECKTTTKSIYTMKIIEYVKKKFGRDKK